MKEIKIGLLGYGTVGAGVAKILIENKELITARLGARLTLKHVADIDTERDRGIHLDDGVLINDADRVVDDPEVVMAVFQSSQGAKRSQVQKVEVGGRSFHTLFHSLFDAADRHVGNLVAIYDVTQHEASLQKRTTYVLSVCILLGGLLIGLFYVYLGSIQRSVREAEDELRNEITERKRAEEAWRKSENQFRTVINATREAMISIEQEGQIAIFNPAAEEMFGYQQQEMIGQRLDNLMPAEYRERHREYIRSYFTTGSPNNAIGRTLELPALRSDGTQFPIEISLSAGQYGQRPFVFAVARDITERKKSEAELLRAKDEAETTNRAKSEFLAHLSCELCAPLDTILTTGRLMLEEDLKPKQWQKVSDITMAGEALQRTVSEVLEYSKIEAGELQLARVPFDLSSLIVDLIGQASASTEGHGSKLTMPLRYDPLAPTQLHGDRDRIKQMVSTLIGEVMKFTVEGFLLTSVSCELRGENCAEFLISVQGSGNTQSGDNTRLTSVCKRQNDVPAPQNCLGSGLGMAITQQIAKTMGGEIGYEGDKRRGVTYWIKLPLELDSTSSTPEPPLAGKHIARVLVADPQAESGAILDDYFSYWQMRSSQTFSGISALSALREAFEQDDPYGIAIMDVRLEEPDVWQVIREIRADVNLRDTIVVITCTANSKTEFTSLKEQGVVGPLTKPFRPADVWQVLTSVRDQWYAAVQEEFANDNGTTSPVPCSEVRIPQLIVPERILLVEDNRSNQMVATRMLQRLGCSQIDHAENGEEALEKLESSRYDLVFLDCQMPVLDGFTTVRRLREREREGNPTQIVAMTAYIMKGIKELCLTEGMDDYISKPFKINSLRAVFERWRYRVYQQQRYGESIATTHDLEDTAGAPPDEIERGKGTIDFNEAAQHVDGDLELLREIFADFIDHVPKCITKLTRLIAAGDCKGAGVEAHGLVGSGRNCGAYRFASLARELEDLVQAGKFEDANQTLRRLEEEFQDIELAFRGLDRKNLQTSLTT